MSTFDPLPVSWTIDQAEPQAAEPLENLSAVVEHALAHPLSTLPLTDLCGAGSRVTVVVAIAGSEHADANAILAPALLHELHTAGVRDQDITILIPDVLHGPSSADEKRLSLGHEIVSRYRCVDHDPSNQAEVDDLGTFQGVPIQVNYNAVEADLLVAIDVVQPHYYAGFSGGAKTISIGCAGEATLNEMRTSRFLDDLALHPPDSPDNLAQIVEREIAHRAGLIFALNAVVNIEGQIMAVSAGAPLAVHDALVRFARALYEVDVPRRDYNIVVAGNGHSRRRTLYHASRAAVSIGLLPEPVLVKGGVIILPVRCGDGTGLDSREQQFYQALSGATDMNTVLRQLSARGIRSGEQRAYMLAHTVIAQKYHIIVVGADCADLARDCGLIPAHNMLEAASLAETIIGRSPRVLMLPHAAHYLPINRWRPNPDDDQETQHNRDIYIPSIISDN